MFEWILDLNAWLGLCTLTILEIILSIDNILFLSLMVDKLPKHQQNKARRLGLAVAMLMRLLLLSSINYLSCLTHPLFSTATNHVSISDLILLLGGMFLIWKASKEIHETIDGSQKEQYNKAQGFFSTLIQIMLLDIIFSLDSVITAVGLSNHLFIMIAAVVSAVGVMMYAAQIISNFVNQHPSMKLLALSFLILVGFTLILESFQIHVPKGYIYFTMFFSMTVEALNLIRNKNNCFSK
ncbi:putative transport [Serratia symbiotica str. 'Cinara cedri']|nr:putative transport [Serratia symbiotica str. 'Cinara cedri']